MYRDRYNLGEFSSISYGALGAARVNFMNVYLISYKLLMNG